MTSPPQIIALPKPEFNITTPLDSHNPSSDWRGRCVRAKPEVLMTAMLIGGIVLLAINFTVAEFPERLQFNRIVGGILGSGLAGVPLGYFFFKYVLGYNVDWCIR